MSTSEFNYHLPADSRRTALRELDIEIGFIGKLQNLKYEYRPDIRDRTALEANFREKFEALNRIKLTDSEFTRLLGEIITPDVYDASKTLRQINAFTRDDGTPLNYTLVNIKDWCRNTFEVVNQLLDYNLTHAIEGYSGQWLCKTMQTIICFRPASTFDLLSSMPVIAIPE
ncbi:MAG: hypothetical protein IPH85_12250 [Ignavibacteria bacterium]|nr:hypothetical protein [Ignavibacteria bacterium]MBK7033840.1 hypothetical protein [Ignavibacteria bacterium]MBK7186666.1 hypothetical protein [Ignavibacteria bacterium]MBK7576225.1 hypothetical protein [Ignavibacteria bacterium]MBK9182337.1 hypothetical protein [Ignavibacteria bacterium]